MLAALLSLCLLFPAQEAAPPGRWMGSAGGPAGSARSYARPLRQEPELAWSWTGGGPIEGPVSTWDGRVLFSVRESSGRRKLLLLELESGKVQLEQSLRANLPLAAVMDGDSLCVRASEERVDVYRLRDGRLGRPRAIRAKRSISNPLLVEGELYLRLDDTLHRFETNKNESSWSAQLPGPMRGQPALLGAHVFALFYTSDGSANLALLERESGRLLESFAMGKHDGKLPAQNAEASLHPSAERVFVHYPLPVKSRSGASFSFGSATLRGAGFAAEAPKLYPYRNAPLLHGSGWIALSGESKPEWLRITQDGSGWSAASLASGRIMPQLAASFSPAALAGDVIYFGGLAADLSDGHVLWKRKPALLRPTPFHGGLLVVEEARTLSALREPRASLSPAQSKAASQAARLVAERASQLAQLAQRSIRLGDGKLTRRLIDDAQRLGASAKQLDPAFRALDRIAGNSKPANPAGNRYRALLAEQRALLVLPAAQLSQLAATASGEEQRALLREALVRDPELESARAQVLDLLPPTAPRPTDAAALGWLDLLDLKSRIPLDLTSLKSDSMERLILAKERDAWRPDLSGYRSERLLLIAPSNQPGAAASCLETGELLCDLLEQLFPPRGAAPPSAPMLILLYPTREEYIAQSQRARSAPEQAFGWTAGHFSATENRSRLFVPERGRSADSLLDVYAHELTHHWLATRSPFSHRSGSDQAPFWIVEGFASLISEFKLNPKQGSWQSRNPRAGSLDKLRAIPAQRLLPWEQLLTLDHAGFQRLAKTPVFSIPLAWRLGQRTPLSATQLFYTQATALAQTLYNGSPQSKAQLLAYVEAWYTRDASQQKAETSLGAKARVLGQRTEQFAGSSR